MVTPTLKIEQSLWKKGVRFVCGLDEVGRGSFAGPVVVGAVVFEEGCTIPEGIADSKLLKPKTREKLAKAIKECALAWAVCEVGVAVINKAGIGQATQMAFRKVVKNLRVYPDFILIDAFSIKHLNKKRQQAVKDGDKVCVSISAASIIAKVHRDSLMVKMGIKYPEYGFGVHKGYGTKIHQEAIKKYGLTKVHRTSFNLSRFI